MTRLTRDFIQSFKQRTEARWEHREIDPDLHGFQFQKGTRWNPGLPAGDIRRYEKDLGFAFPPDVRLLLAHMNGTDTPTLNVYGYCGEPQREGVGVYAYPADLEQARQRMAWAAEAWPDRGALLAALRLRGQSDGLLPYYSCRYLVCGPDFPDTPVLSIAGDDAVVYAPSLCAYLQKEFLRDPREESEAWDRLGDLW